jgi:hypothetical protein
MNNLTLETVQRDHAATLRDIENLTGAIDNLERFINDPDGDNRERYKTYTFVLKALRNQAQDLLPKIQKHLDSFHP